MKLKAVDDGGGQCGLVGRTFMCADFPAVRCAAALRQKFDYFGGTLAVGDVVVGDEGKRCGMVESCCQESDGLYVIVDAFRSVGTVSKTNSRWLSTNSLQVWSPCRVVPASAWRREGDHFVVLTNCAGECWS